MDNLNPSKKAQLKEVADLMLEIYRTLARMQYLDPAWIQEGPHGVDDDLLQMFESHNLDPCVIYLYSILPYVDTGGVAEVDFFQGSEFADFRRSEHVERGRDPFYDSQVMPPWMTPLSLLGNHQSVIIYDSRKHEIAILDQESGGSTDHNINEVLEAQKDEESDGEKEEEIERDEEYYDEEEGDEDEDEDDTDEDDGGSEGPFDEMASRPADRVLRDIVQWYNELIEIPGGGERSGREWAKEIVKPLYTKLGWPEADFDGEAFLVEQARASAAATAKYNSEELIREAQIYRGYLEESDSLAMHQRRQKLAESKTTDEEWVSRWELWHAESTNCHNVERLKDAEAARDRTSIDGHSQKLEELPLWELKQLREDLWSEKRQLKRLEQNFNDISINEGEINQVVQGKLRRALKRVAIYQKAYEASKNDAERLCPGKSWPSGPGVETLGFDVKARLEQLTKSIEHSQSWVKDIKNWRTQLPEAATQAKRLAQAKIDQHEGIIKTLEAQKSALVLEMEKLCSENE
ncbi:hypothetical protein BGZ63DRAFT_387386 [Mariannaea sp. PMI_226]|nr:hypothetical protein BGZ63DRAFT_387386 [Mariannaea sp. PMI_226]